MAFMMIATITSTAHNTRITASGLLLRFFTSSAIFLSRSVFSLYWTAGLLRSSVTGASSSSALRFGAAGEEVSRSFWESICA